MSEEQLSIKEQEWQAFWEGSGLGHAMPHLKPQIQMAWEQGWDRGWFVSQPPRVHPDHDSGDSYVEMVPEVLDDPVPDAGPT